MSTDRTSYGQSLTHMIKGNLGAGILAMPASFAHTGLIGGVVGLPILCLIAVYCVHILLKASRLVESKSKDLELNYSNLARQSFEVGPKQVRRYSKLISWIVDSTLLITQIGVCCVYIVFIVDNITSIMASNDIIIPKPVAFLAILPVTLLLSFIRTLKRLSMASLVANLLQAIGLALIIEYLTRNSNQPGKLAERDYFRPLDEMALGFGSIMFAFEGISVVLPVYSQMKNPKRMSSCLGVVNVAFLAILLLYFIVGLLGYMKFGHNIRDSITLNLPAEPLYDAVRGMFTCSILLSYPLQFYVPNAIIWNWTKKNLLEPTKHELSVIRAIEVVIPPGTKITETLDGVKQLPETTTSSNGGNCAPSTNNRDNHTADGGGGEGIMTKASCDNDNNRHNYNTNSRLNDQDNNTVPLKYEYCCRCVVVLLTFTIAYSVPKLNLLMDLIGSFSGVALCLTIPAILHLVTFWNETRGLSKAMMIIADSTVLIVGLVAGASGSLSSLMSIAKSFH